MDFNTGRGSGRPPKNSGGGSSGPMFGGEGPARAQAGGSGTEFALSDPLRSFFSSFAGVITQPTTFYRGISRGGDFVSPLVFGLICCAVAGLLYGFFSLFLAVAFGGQGLLGAIVTAVFNIFLITLLGAGGMFLLAGIVHLLVRAYVRPNAGFEATFRVVAYSYATQVLGGWIPIANLFVGLWALYLGVVGVREVHSTTTGRAIRSFGVIIFLYGILFLGIVVAILIPLLLQA